MKLARFEHSDNVYLGLVDAAASMISAVNAPPAIGDPMIATIQAQIGGYHAELRGIEFNLADVRLLPPIATPSKNILCVGKNYAAHATEFARSGFDSSAKGTTDIVPHVPIIFSKAPCAMIGARDDIRPPWDITSKVDYERSEEHTR
ncbi:MAG: Rv2993c-like domain-containing protein, partial [Gammaproteobacteria bacterium]